MPAFPFRGVFTALVTPFRDGAVDEPAFAALVERQIAAGVHGLVPVGTTGETSTLTHEEHRRVVTLCVETCRGRVPVIAGAGSNATAEAISLVRHAKAVGADAALVVTPYYNRPNQDGLFQHYAAIVGEVDFPILAYNVPTRTGVDLSHDAVVRLSRLKGVIGVKDATGDLSRPSLQRRDCGLDWGLLSGDDPSALGYMAHGGHGCISVTSNVAPRAVARLFDACLAGRWDAALALQDTLIRLHRALARDSSPAPTKRALSLLGLCVDELRLPLTPCADGLSGEIEAALQEAGARP